jgi:hypothetical protein
MLARDGSGSTASDTSFERTLREAPGAASYATLPAFLTMVPGAVTCATDCCATVRPAANNSETLNHAFARLLNAPKAE